MSSGIISSGSLSESSVGLRLATKINDLRVIGAGQRVVNVITLIIIFELFPVEYLIAWI